MVVPIRQLTSGRGNSIIARIADRADYRTSLRQEYGDKPSKELLEIVENYEGRNLVIRILDWCDPFEDNDIEYEVAKEFLEKGTQPA